MATTLEAEDINRRKLREIHLGIASQACQLVSIIKPENPLDSTFTDQTQKAIVRKAVINFLTQVKELSAEKKADLQISPEEDLSASIKEYTQSKSFLLGLRRLQDFVKEAQPIIEGETKFQLGPNKTTFIGKMHFIHQEIANSLIDDSTGLQLVNYVSSEMIRKIAYPETLEKDQVRGIMLATFIHRDAVIGYTEPHIDILAQLYPGTH